jgi:hypothetical protein
MADESSLKDLWGRRIAGIEFDESKIFRPITPEDVAYLRNKYPFLQLINTEADFSKEIVPEFITSKSGWTIHDYGDAMSSSSGEDLFDGWDDKALLADVIGAEEEGGEEGGEAGGFIYTGKGTIIKQMIDTGFDMVNLAMQKNWAGVEIIDGAELMKWAAWAAASEKNFAVQGFEPDEEDEKRRRRISSKILAEKAAVLQPE